MRDAGVWTNQNRWYMGIALWGTAGPALAIPSPDLVVNLSASAAQLVGLLTVMFGGMAYSARRRGATGVVGAAPGWRWGALALAGVLMVSVTGNVFQYTRYADANNRRLHTNLWRPSVEEGRSVGDTSLKTLSFSDQLARPRGLATDELARWLEAGRALHLIDVREPEEVEMGHVAGATPVRYPDLWAHPQALLREGGQNVLLCYSGNRSSELCERFAARGYPCRFLVGGYEKWISEGRPLQLEGARHGNELRELPGFRNQSTLLDTPRVMRMVREEGAVFADVRYPGDFRLGHLPQAINIPLRRLPSDEMWSRLKALPKRPVIAPCYDKRSCFYAQILGLRLERLGYDFRGRYTVPHEYAAPQRERAHVAHWREAHQGASLLGFIARPLQGMLQSLSDWSGHLAAGIALLVLALRALFLPLALKAERDQLVQAALAPEIGTLRERLAHDGQRLSRAIMGRYRKAGLTPLRNLLGSVGQVVLFLVFFSVVDRMAQGSTQGLLWMPALGEPDPTRALPVLVGLGLFAYLYLGSGRRGGLRMALFGALGVGLALLLVDLNAAVNVYLALSLGLVFAQSALLRTVMARRGLRGGDRAEALVAVAGRDPGIVPLAQSHRFRGTGNKAARLARMKSAGLPVPDGFCLTATLLEGCCGRDGADRVHLPVRERRRLARLWRRLGTRRVAVRSSGLNEDGANQSYAGVFESRLNVGWDDLLPSLQQVWTSLRSARAGAYSGAAQESGGVLVQVMVEAEYAGVLFTEHPASSGALLVELVEGLGEDLVSGTRTPQDYAFGVLSHQALDPRQPPIDLGPLLALADRVQALFGGPQDIEWAYAKGRFVLLQARDITCSVCEGDRSRNIRERERQHLLGLARGLDPQRPVFVQNELAELLPRPTPLSAAFMERFWAPGGSTDLACRRLGIAYDVAEDSPPYVNTVYGGLYVNQPEALRRIRRGPGMLASFRLMRGAEAIERSYRERFLPGFLDAMRIHEAMDFRRLELAVLLRLFASWGEAFFTEHYVEAEVINVAADIYCKTATRKLQAAGLDPAEHLGLGVETVVHRAMSMLVEIHRGERPMEAFLGLFGHRAPEDYELMQPRYREDPQRVHELIERATAAQHGTPQTAPLPKDPMLALVVGRAQRFQALKEEAKHHGLIELANLRRLLLALDGRLGLDGGIFFLGLDEVTRLKGQGDLESVRARIAVRRREAQVLEAVELPSTLSIRDLERIESAFAARTEGSATLSGVRVAGEGDVVGPVQVIHHAQDIDAFEDGHIIVSRFTDPTWTPLFPRARGVVTEVGGWLSHAAIVAREYHLTAIVGVAGSTRALHSGDLVHLHPDGRIERLPERRREQRVAVSLRLSVQTVSAACVATALDLSRSGARIEMAQDPAPGQCLRITVSGEVLDARIVRSEGAGRYGLRFEAPLDEAQWARLQTAA